MVLKKYLKEKRKMNKKGIFFTLLTIAILALFLITYSINNAAKQRESLKDRVETLNTFVFSIQDDLQRKMYISGYRVLVCFERRISNSNGTVFIDNVNLRFNEAFFNGSLNGEVQSLMTDSAGSGGARFSDLVQDIKGRGNKSNIDIEFYNPTVLMSQDDPWNVKITLLTGLLISDRGGLVEWNKTLSVNSYIPIENFDDPTYYTHTNNDLSPKFRSNPNFSVSGSAAQIKSNITYQINNQLYINHTTAPSFLDRFEGNLSGYNINGIESFVNVSGIKGTRFSDRSTVDYIYFKNVGSSSCSVTSVTDWFRLGDNNAPSNITFYNIACS
jgi:hypothetical protein